MSAVEQLYTDDIIEIVLDVPFPPSVNHIWKRAGKRVFRSAKYIRWMEATDMAVMGSKQYPRRKLRGKFEAHILLSESAGGGDCDNRIKCVLDWCTSRDVISDDRFCRKLTIEWAPHKCAPAGCRVVLRSINGEGE